MLTEAIAALHRHRPAVVAIGASAGAIQALRDLLPEVPPGLPAPILVVVHIPAGVPSALPDLVRSLCDLSVREVEDKMPLRPGTVYTAAPDYHLLVDEGPTVSLSADEPVMNSRPAIDVLFDSIADTCRRQALGILLSGANADGAAGLARMRACGALTWVQRPDTAEMPTMPEAALALADHPALPPATMGRALAAWGGGRHG